MTPGDGRIERALALLRSHGASIRGASAAGAAGDVLAVHADAAQVARVRSIAPRLRELGFRYVAVELGGDGRGDA
ncbi:MAG TPA: hypothetical protein VML95_03390 [Longimicrobiales bacterium]|nr:hypothetical protein [Longimicrobiales bacterium]